MKGGPPEYLFLTAAPLVRMGDMVTAQEASARLGSLLPTLALTMLGYDARTMTVHRDTSVAEAAMVKAKRIVFGDMPIDVCKRLLALIDEPQRRVVFSMRTDPVEFPQFYREALPRCLSVTTVSERLADTIRSLTPRPVYLVPEPLEGPRGEPRATAARRPSRVLRWLARRASVPTESWRARLLWFGHSANLGSLLELLPDLEKLSADYMLQLSIVTTPVAELSSLLTAERTGAEAALRLVFVPRAPGVVEAMIAQSDLVLIPTGKATSPHGLLAALHGGRLAIAHPTPGYEPYSPFAWIGGSLAEGIRWALSHPREVMERVTRGQAFIDQKHSAEVVARAWLVAFRADGSGVL